MITADRAFASVMGKVAEFGALVERQNGIGGKRAKAHCRDVVQRKRVGLGAIAFTDGHAEVIVLDMFGVDGVVDPFIIVAIDIGHGAVGALIDYIFGALIHQVALCARKGDFLSI